MSELPFNPKNAYRISFGEITDAKLVNIDVERKVVEFTTSFKGADGEIRAIRLSNADGVLGTLTATFTIKKWQPNPFNPHHMPTLWYLHRKKFTSQN